eukprot:CAMPEP_0117675706 /NCGR_PEP_ID=MMETSP0804-20121206/15757_1 /TAXON_ID=1074897 /ORGANISM="Tetraselmis astigmatica, Strain CCMP880" /LENGTH=66 /DNA_ID=CAMNT_0005484745 /DNA_START=383 /DNA_END=583 /DNA_ORIENTATION=-
MAPTTSPGKALALTSATWTWRSCGILAPWWQKDTAVFPCGLLLVITNEDLVAASASASAPSTVAPP